MLKISRNAMAALLAPALAEPRARRGPFDPIPTVPVTLHPVTLREITDEDVGLTHDPLAQARAERFIMAVLGHRDHEKREAARRARVAAAAAAPLPDVRSEPAAPTPLVRKATPTVNVTVPDASLTLIEPTDDLSDVEQGIVQELRRLSEKPRARWAH